MSKGRVKRRKTSALAQERASVRYWKEKADRSSVEYYGYRKAVRDMVSKGKVPLYV